MRVEIGPRDLTNNQATIMRRIAGSKTPVELDGVSTAVATALDDDQGALYAEALVRRDSHTADVATLGDAIDAAATGFARLPWSECGLDGEAKAAEQGVTVRCLQRADGTVPDTLDEPDLVAILARAY